MGYEIGNFIYALHVTNVEEDLKIEDGLIDNFYDIINDDLNFYYYESVLLKFKHLIENNIYISEKTIREYLKIFKCKRQTHEFLNIYIPNLSRLFVEINNCTYPVSIISLNREPILKYFDFLKRVFEIENGNDIHNFIKNNLR